MPPTSTQKKRKASELEDPKSSSNEPFTDGTTKSPEQSQPQGSLAMPEYAMIPFKIHLDPPEGTIYPVKRRKGAADDKFGPQLEATEEQIKLRYTVRPGSKWQSMKPYRNFIVSEKKFGVGDYIYINHSDIPQNIIMENLSASSVANDRQNFWPARVLEVRASDAQHVYLRVFWLYWPDELPMGRQDYHGNAEVVMSNHMEIVDAMTVACGADEIKHWHERDDGDDDDVGPLFFRQYLNVLDGKLSEIRKHCACGSFYNPDRTLIGCSNESCKIWMHEECVVDDVLGKVYARLVPEDASSAKSAVTTNEASGKTPKSSAKRVSKAATVSLKKKPWEGKFTASIDTQKAGVAGKVTVTDERGQDPETWTETVLCLKCGKPVDP